MRKYVELQDKNGNALNPKNLTYETEFEEIKNRLSVLENKSEIILYNNSNGIASNITLSDSIANYRYIEIYYKTNDGNEYTASQKIQVSGQTIKTFLSYDHLYANINYTKIAEVSLNGTSLTFNSNYQTDNGGSPATGTYIYVTKVVGYK